MKIITQIKKYWPLIVIILLVLFSRIWQLETLPHGLAGDEADNGYNAHLIATTLHDAKGEFLPPLFSSDSRGGIHIYSTALVFKIFGPSIVALRLPSVFVMLALVLIVYIFVQKLFDSRAISSFAALSTGFLPWFFPASRISFVIIYYVAIVAAIYLCTYLTFYSKKPNRYIYSALTGALFGLSFYSYHAAKFMSLVIALSIGLMFLRKKTIKIFVVMFIACAVVLIPYFNYSYVHKNSLTHRFKELSFVYKKDMGVDEKIAKFGKHYVNYFSPDFLLLKGDGNKRHATGHGGEIFVTILLLSVLSLLGYKKMKKKMSEEQIRYLQLSIILLLVSPVPGALTGASWHALRTMTTGLAYIYLASFGVYYVFQSTKKTMLNITLIALFLMLLFEAYGYTNDYFSKYSKRNQTAFRGHGLLQAMEKAVDLGYEKVFVLNNIQRWRFEFFRSVIGENGNTNFKRVSMEEMVPENGQCIIAHKTNSRSKKPSFSVNYEMPDDYSNYKSVKINNVDKPQVNLYCNI